MEWSDLLNMLFRWLHIAAGIFWIGLLLWFNFINSGFAPTMDAETKKKVVPELMPRALWWFRMSAATTWVLGILLLALVFYMGKQMFPEQAHEWTLGSYVMLALTFLMFPVYDMAAKGGLGKDNKTFAVGSFVVIAIIVYLMYSWGGFGYRAYNIHLGTMFGTLMAANVWMRIWKAQEKIIAAAKAGTAPDQALVTMSMQRSRHNVYMSIPLLWTMINAHTVALGEEHWYYLLIVVALGWLLVIQLYKVAGKIKGI